MKVNKIPGGVEEREEVKRLKEEQKQVWREVGRDLRHIADTFTIKKTQVFINSPLDFCFSNIHLPRYV